ncbi:MAG TPA: hypothetical protein VMF69_19030 [Gemmataceae bacterium]|nr:hypothetical protein [Gemmataceae bacterium]
MLRQLSLVLSATALAATLSQPATAQEYSNGGLCASGRKAAILTPVEAFGVHPPGPDPADLHRRIFCWWKKIFTPYYAPLSPTSTSVRWKPWCYFPLMPYYTPYYIGYCPKRLHNPKPLPYGFDGGWGPGPAPDHPFPPNPGDAPLNYAGYTSVIQDDTVFWNMGGNGLVPYGTPRPPHEGPPDLVDAIQVSRQQGGGLCAPPPDGPPLAAAPAILPPAEAPITK